MDKTIEIYFSLFWNSAFSDQDALGTMICGGLIDQLTSQFAQCFPRQLDGEQFLSSLVVQGACQRGSLHLSVNGHPLHGAEWHVPCIVGDINIPQLKTSILKRPWTYVLSSSTGN